MCKTRSRQPLTDSHLQRGFEPRRAPSPLAFALGHTKPSPCDTPCVPQHDTQRKPLTRNSGVPLSVNRSSKPRERQPFHNLSVPLGDEFAFHASRVARVPDALPERAKRQPRFPLQQFRRAPRKGSVFQHLQLSRVNGALLQHSCSRLFNRDFGVLARFAFASLRGFQSVFPLPRFSLQA